MANRDKVQTPAMNGNAACGGAKVPSVPDDLTSRRKHRSPHVAQAVLLASALGQLGIALIITIFLARVLPPSAFGFFSLVGTIFILARKVLDLGLSNVAARDVAKDPRRERPILEGMMAYRRVAGLALAISLCIYAWMQHSQPERLVLALAAMVLLFTEPAALDPVFQVRQAQGGPALLNLAGGLLVLFGSVLFKRFALAGATFAVLLLIQEAVLLFVTRLLAQRLLGYHPRPGFRGRNLKAFVGPALIFGLASLVYTVYFNCDVFFVLALRGRDELGAYAAAFRPINPLLLLPWLLMVPLIPVLTATAPKDAAAFVAQVRSASAIAVGIGATGVVAGVMLAPDLVHLLYRGRYLEGALSCVDAFRWLALALGLVCVTTVLTASMLAASKEKALLAIGTAALAANVALNLMLLRHYNFTAAGFATAATELLFLLAAFVTFRRVMRSSPLDWRALSYLLPALLTGAFLYFLHASAVMRVICGIVLGLVSVSAILVSPPARRFREQVTSNALVFSEEGTSVI